MKIEKAYVLQANVYVPLKIIILNNLEWERKMESKVFIVDMKGSNILLKLVNLWETQSDKQRYKIKMWARYSWLIWMLQDLFKACSTYDGIKMTSKGYENETWYVVA